jgi:indolepyruvate ferredoxin oxidoreductase alpha subunit
MPEYQDFTGIRELPQLRSSSMHKSQKAAENNIHRTWSSNEKTALEAALGMSASGKRAMVTMKHVGLNVAADPLMNSAITGASGGLIIAVADDPSMHSSQNEQDSRYYGNFAMIPVLEPGNHRSVMIWLFTDSNYPKSTIYLCF